MREFSLSPPLISPFLRNRRAIIVTASGVRGVAGSTSRRRPTVEERTVPEATESSYISSPYVSSPSGAGIAAAAKLVVEGLAVLFTQHALANRAASDAALSRRSVAAVRAMYVGRA
jgi:hypothetical protein